MTETTVNLSQIAQLARVGRAAVANWRRRHEDFPPSVGGTETSPLFLQTAAEQWLRNHDRIPPPPSEPNTPRLPATVTFANGSTVTVHGPELHTAPAWNGYADEEAFSGYIAPDRDGIPWPTASARIDLPGQAPFEVTNAHVDISGWGGRMNFLKLIWPTGQRTVLPADPTDPQTMEAH
ncbi:hypothetical protein [Streptomyces sp. Isolate_45]|uniref:hypothetical protein n=1 Tax=Streptomyces sp. Isolate_45 TaxID=2950111 RepID=UPI0024819883|nr:hypothetical protein [Streptomyces sp. Isolate_45]MDA5279922.1 hypothetical protein [Streptomyces sp. Isolate_45]